MADEHDALMREVDEELRRERMEKLWQRYNGVIFGVAALIIAGVGGYKWLEARRIANAETAGAAFANAVSLEDEKKADEARKAFDAIATDGPAGYAAVARLHVAGAAAKAGKTEEAVAAYEALAKDVAADDLLRKFAQLQAASLKLDSADFTEIQNRLTPLTGEGSAFKASAEELLGLAAYKAKNYAEARRYLEPLLIAPDASSAVQQRVKVVLANIAEAETGQPAAGEAPKVQASPAAPAAGAVKNGSGASTGSDGSDAKNKK